MKRRHDTLRQAIPQIHQIKNVLGICEPKQRQKYKTLIPGRNIVAELALDAAPTKNEPRPRKKARTTNSESKMGDPSRMTPRSE
jgi:hypothetical protein